MATRIGINGFGRIGRFALRLALKDPTVEVVGINDIGSIETMAHLFKYDSLYGRAPHDVSVDGSNLLIDGKKIPVFAEKDPSQLPWKSVNAAIIIESTGRFTDKEKAGAHLKGGARKVIISAPGKEVDGTFVMGVNHSSYDPVNHHIVSNASCTTNCLAPFAKVLHDRFGIESGLMTTIHSYTNDQHILDAPHSDLRRARAGAVSMIPTSTGAAKAVGLVLPELKGKLDGFAIRVPTPVVSCVDLVAVLKKAATADEVNASLKKASEGELKGILGFSTEPLVSADYINDPRASVIDAMSTKTIGNVVKVLSWYDNEAGFTHQLINLAKWMGAKL